MSVAGERGGWLSIREAEDRGSRIDVTVARGERRDAFVARGSRMPLVLGLAKEVEVCL